MYTRNPAPQHLQFAPPKPDPVTDHLKNIPGYEKADVIAERYWESKAINNAYSTPETKAYNEMFAVKPVPYQIPEQKTVGISNFQQAPHQSLPSQLADQLKIQGQVYESQISYDKTMTANRMLAQNPPNFEGASFILQRPLTSDEISSRIVTNVLSNIRQIATNVPSGPNGSVSQQIQQSIPTILVGQTPLMTPIRSRINPIPMERLTGKLISPSVSIAETQIAPTISNSPSIARLNNLSYHELKTEAKNLGYIHPRKGAASQQELRDYIRSIYGQSLHNAPFIQEHKFPDPNRLGIKTPPFKHAELESNLRRSIREAADAEDEIKQQGEGLWSRARVNAPLGKLLVDTKKLSQGVLSLLFFHNKRKPTQLPNTHVSQSFVAIVHTLMSGTYPNEHLVKLLSVAERALLKKLLKTAHIYQKGTSLDNVASLSIGGFGPKELLNKLYVNLGALHSGADNPMLRNQTSMVIDQLLKKGILSNSKAAQLTKEFIANV